MAVSTHLGRMVLLGGACGLLLLAVGCSRSGDVKYKVSGTLTRGGQPLEYDLVAGGTVELTFHQMKGNKRPEPDDDEEGADCSPRPPGTESRPKPGSEPFSLATSVWTDGHWTVDGLPAGKYLITVGYYP